MRGGFGDRFGGRGMFRLFEDTRGGKSVLDKIVKMGCVFCLRDERTMCGKMRGAGGRGRGEGKIRGALSIYSFFFRI